MKLILSLSDSMDASDRFSASAYAPYVPLRYKSRDLVTVCDIDWFLSAAHKGFDRDKMSGTRSVLKYGHQFDSLPLLCIKRTGDPLTDEVYGHEGRHRALALKELGYTSMPVRLNHMTIRWSEANDPTSFDYAKVWPLRLRGEDHNFLDFPQRNELKEIHR